MARRHGLAPGHRFAGPTEVADGLVALHATDTPTVHLAIAARTDGTDLARTTRALGDGRQLHVQLAMRRTQWAATDQVVDTMLAGPAARVAAAERRILTNELIASQVTVDPQRWLRRAEADLLAALDHDDLSAAELASASPRLARRVVRGPGTRWQTEASVASRLLTVLWAEGRVSRATSPASWVANRAVWTTSLRRRGARPPLADPRTAWADLVGRWLRRFGPGTEADLRWWTGSTAGIVRTALADVGAVEVGLDGGASGWVAPGDEEPVDEPGRWAALLPTLDPTTMGYQQRSFLTGGHAAELFDRAGNGGTTAWVDGRMVGAWSTTRDGRVRVHLLEEVDREATELLAQRCAALERFIDGRGVTGLYSSPLVARILREERR